MVAVGVERPKSLWFDGRFVLFTAARAVSWAGTAITLVALPMLLYQRTQNASLTALLTAAEALPYLVFGLLAGALADRWPRRTVMVLISVAQAVLLASVPLADVAGILGAGHLLAVALASAGFAVFFDAASFSAIPQLAGRARLAEATSASAGIHTMIGLLGPTVGGVVAASLGAANAIGVDAVSYALAAILLGRLPLLRADGAGERAGTRLRADIADGLRFVWRHPLIRPLTLLGIGNSMTAGAVLGLLLPMAVRQVGLAPDDARIGLFYGVAGLGGLLATLLLPWLARRIPVGWVSLGGLLANWLLLLGWVSAPGLVPALIVLGLWQATNTLVTLNGILVRQRMTPDALQGRVNTTGRMIAWGGQPLGAALGGALAAGLGVPAAVVCSGAGVLLAGLLGLATPLRARNADAAARNADAVTG
ncbi:MFS transporter [Amycolatopsis anabasis]|uniref:MFS transporter n=1 Tax=Amycolatopsis anabasis TaxID=1840409 RepID=UPI00131BB090|nr:MFS transporter [Amycolatopsis anabasis]